MSDNRRQLDSHIYIQSVTICSLIEVCEENPALHCSKVEKKNFNNFFSDSCRYSPLILDQSLTS